VHKGQTKLDLYLDVTNPATKCIKTSRNNQHVQNRHQD